MIRGANSMMGARGGALLQLNGFRQTCACGLSQWSRGPCGVETERTADFQEEPSSVGMRDCRSFLNQTVYRPKLLLVDEHRRTQNVTSAHVEGRIAAGPVSGRTARATNSGSTPPTNLMGPLPEYLIDAFQRNVLFLDILRRRGDEEIEITSRPMATVLHYEHELVMSGRSLPRPMNYSLLRILPRRGRD